MKDSYSFDRDEEGLDVSFRKHAAAYDRIFERCGLETYAVQAESGMMGGSESDRLPRARRARARTRSSPASAATTRPISRSRAACRGRRSSPTGSTRRSRSRRPESTTIEALAAFLGIDAAATSKAMPVVKTDGTLVLGLVRGDDRLEEAKMVRCGRLGHSRPRPRTRSARRSAPTLARSARSAVEARSSPTRRCAKGSSSPAPTAPAGTSAASSMVGTPAARFADIRQPREGDACPRCGGALRFQTAIEVGHIFKLGTQRTRSRSARRSSTRTGRRSRSSWAATGSGPARSWPQSVEQRHDEQGIAWPRGDRPVRCPRGRAPGRTRAGGAGRRAARTAGQDVLLDDRDLRAGEKFADADLIGCPFRVTVGKKTLESGEVDVRNGQPARSAPRRSTR